MGRIGAIKLVVAVAAVAAVLAAGQTPAGARADRTGATGSITEYNLPAGAGTETTITYGPDGRLWFPELFHDQVGTITTKGVIVNYPIASGSSVYTATPGADGNIWLAEHDSKKLGVMNTAGTILHEYPFASSAPYGITAGPDGNLWWTDEFAGTGKIGQTTTAGITVEFTNPVGFPRDITPGPDGNLWFTADKETISKVTPSGVITHYTIPTSSGYPSGITAGPDGALWFTERAGNNIGRVTTSGTFTEYPIPTPNSSPLGITAGTDGNLWFTEGGGNKIGEITPSGTITEFDVPSPSGDPVDITPGPDGNLWFVEGAHRAGKVQDTAANTSYVLAIASGFVNKTVTLKKQGQTVKWTFLGPTNRSATDSSGMGLFDSGSHSPVSYFSFKFTAAGSYAYKDSLHPSTKGTVRVPIVVQSAGGGTQAAVTWASAAPPSGDVYDVQVEQPSSGTFVDWKTGQTATNGTFGPGDPLYVGAGVYGFRARVRKSSNGKAVGYSTAASITLP
jgi:streptogramin lyase